MSMACRQGSIACYSLHAKVGVSNPPLPNPTPPYTSTSHRISLAPSRLHPTPPRPPHPVPPRSPTPPYPTSSCLGWWLAGIDSSCPRIMGSLLRSSDTIRSFASQLTAQIGARAQALAPNAVWAAVHLRAFDCVESIQGSNRVPNDGQVHREGSRHPSLTCNRNCNCICNCHQDSGRVDSICN